MASLCWFWICIKSMKPFLSCLFGAWCTLSLCETLSEAWCSFKLETDSYSVFLSLSLSKKMKWSLWCWLNEEKSAFVLLCEEESGCFSLHCVWHQHSAWVWAWSRACLVSLPSSFPFPDFLCMLRPTAGLCERLSAASGFATLCSTLNPPFIILCHGEQGNSRLNKLGANFKIKISIKPYKFSFVFLSSCLCLFEHNLSMAGSWCRPVS